MREGRVDRRTVSSGRVGIRVIEAHAKGSCSSHCVCMNRRLDLQLPTAVIILRWYVDGPKLRPTATTGLYGGQLG